jgi:hypothetical protein
MASTCSVYKHGILLGTGSVSAASASLTSYSGTAPGPGRNVMISITQAGTHSGRSFAARVLAGSGTATLTLSQACPFVGA